MCCLGYLVLRNNFFHCSPLWDHLFSSMLELSLFEFHQCFSKKHCPLLFRWKKPSSSSLLSPIKFLCNFVQSKKLWCFCWKFGRLISLPYSHPFLVRVWVWHLVFMWLYRQNRQWVGLDCLVPVWWLNQKHQLELIVQIHWKG